MNTQAQKPVIGFLGTGLMGAPMARNLLKAGFEVHVWNRSPEKAAVLAADDAIIHDQPSRAAGEANYTITMVSDGRAVSELLFDCDVTDAMSKGATLIDMSSIRPAEARDHSARLRSRGIHHIDAPVSGGTRGAEAATLAIMAGGERECFEAAKPVLQAMGRPVHVGPSGSGQLAKLANQAIVASTIGVVAEAMLLVRQGGGDPDALREALKGGFADSVILQQHGERMTTGNFVPGGASRVQLKDMENIIEEAAKLDLTLPLSEQMQARYHRFVNELDGAEKDHSAIFLELLDLNKLIS